MNISASPFNTIFNYLRLTNTEVVNCIWKFLKVGKYPKGYLTLKQICILITAVLSSLLYFNFLSEKLNPY